MTQNRSPTSSIAIVANTSFLIHAAVLAMLPQMERRVSAGCNSRTLRNFTR
nr:MAG TPA: hypothetical protein [Caudoviricetes sp.]